MARTTTGAALTAGHVRLQRALAAGIMAQLLRLWPIVTPTIPGSFDRFAAAAALLVVAGHRSSASLAADYSTAFRTVEGVPDTVPPIIAAPPAPEYVANLIRGAAVVGIMRARGAGRDVAAALDAGFVEVAGQTTSLVLGGGRKTMLATMGADRAAKGYRRVTSGTPCSFCAMIASRDVSFRYDFESHAHCRCSMEPAYAGSQPTAAQQQWRTLWDESTVGLSGGEARNAFRRAYEAGVSP